MRTTFEVRASIPGTVSVLSVPDGAAVDQGEILLEIECMKTLWPLSAPATGIVRFDVQICEVVAQEQLVATVEADD